MVRVIQSYFILLYGLGNFIYLGLIATEWAIRTRRQVGYMVLLFILRYIFYGSVKGGNMSGNTRSWQTIGLGLLDTLLPLAFIYFLFICRTFFFAET